MVGDAKRMTILINEYFEGTGYEETWTETVGGSNSIDEDALSSDVGSPDGWGLQCLHIDIPTLDANAYTYRSLGTPAGISYTRVDIIITAESLSSGENNVLLYLMNPAFSTVFALSLNQNGGGLAFILNSKHDGTNNFYQGFPTVTVGTRYRLEFKWDATANKWAWKIDGWSQPNDQDFTDPVTLEGDLTSTHLTTVGIVFLGAPASVNQAAGETHYDRVVMDDSTWVGNSGGQTYFLPSSLALTAAQALPSITGDANISMSAQSLSAAQISPLIIGDVSISMSAQSLSLAQPSPSIIRDMIINVPAQSLSAAQISPLIIGDVSISVSAQSLSVTQVSPLIAMDMIVNVLAQSLGIAQASPLIIGDVSISVSAQSLTVAAILPVFEMEALSLSISALSPVIVIDAVVELLPMSIGLDIDMIEAVASDDVKIIVTNARTFAISEYAAMAFNSMAKFNGKYLYAKADGIYEGGGDSDDGTDISASYKTGSFDINATEVQKPRNAFLNFRSSGDIQLFLVGNEINARHYNITNSTAETIHERRVKFERGIRDNHFSFGISNIAGSSFEIKTAKILTEPIRKRR
jgi:hypothetical protein